MHKYIMGYLWLQIAYEAQREVLWFNYNSIQQAIFYMVVNVEF